MNVLIGECYPYSEDFVPGRRSGWTPVYSTDDYINGIDETLASTVMPYGLAASLLVDENPTAANFFQQRYEGLLNRFGKELPVRMGNDCGRLRRSGKRRIWELVTYGEDFNRYGRKKSFKLRTGSA